MKQPTYKTGDKVTHYTAPKDVMAVKAVEFHEGHGVHIYRVESLQTGEIGWVPEYELSVVDNPKFKPGDIVEVAGYLGQWEVQNALDNGLYEVADANMSVPEKMHAAEEDMTLVKVPGPVEFKATNGPRLHRKFTSAQPHRKYEMEVLSRMDYNRQVAQRLKEWQDWFLDLYNLTNDPRYLRRVKRVQGWIEKVPTRAYHV